MSEYTPHVVREYLDGWQDLQAGRWPDATLMRRKLQGGNSPARTVDGGRDLSIARTIADVTWAYRCVGSTAQMVIYEGIFENKAPKVGSNRDWTDVAEHLHLQEVWHIYSHATESMAYRLGWRRETSEIQVLVVST